MSYRVSSNLTFILKIIIPTIWTTFFGLFVIAFFTVDPEQAPILHNPVFKWGFLAGYLTFVGFLLLTFMRLLRVEYDAEAIYVTNYFKTVRYTWDSIDHIKSYNLGIVKLISIRLRDKGQFGKKIRYIAARTRLQDILAETPSIAAFHKQKGA